MKRAMLPMPMLRAMVTSVSYYRVVRDILRSIQGQSRVPSRGIPSRESIEPSDPIEWVRAPPSEWGMDVHLNHPITAH